MTFNPLSGLEFLLSQFAVIGPIVFAILLVAFARLRRPDFGSRDRLMLCFAVPVLLLITATAVITHAHANWAAVAAVSAAILAAAVLVRRSHRLLIATSIAIGVLAQTLFVIADANAYRISLPLLANPDIYQPTLGWRALGQRADEIAAREGVSAIAAERREDVASLIYYLRGSRRQVFSWASSAQAENQFDLSNRLTAAVDPVLLMTRCADAQRLAANYGSVKSLGRIDIGTGPNSTRRYFVFKLGRPHVPLGLSSGC